MVRVAQKLSNAVAVKKDGSRDPNGSGVSNRSVPILRANK